MPALRPCPCIAAHGWRLIPPAITVPFPYSFTATVTGGPSGEMTVEMSDRVGPKPPGDIVHQFAPGYFGVLTGYTFATEAPIGLYTLGHPDSPVKELHVSGLLETWWYPRPMFVVFRRPGEGQVIHFRSGDPLCHAVPVVCGGLDIRQVDKQEEVDFSVAKQNYEEERRARVDLTWTSVEGESFSRLYKEKSRQSRREFRRTDR
ncbi:DUF6065 family protein [Wenjunlia tyrosinilytica]|uniref:DUF6065 family protein n=1 Tax=Wenjunlia tyrosinilytica TaxID=1544741 RepID=UPI00357174D9